MRITKVGVVGAGVMGSGIAALAASAGFPLSCSTYRAATIRPRPIVRHRPATALEKARKAKPAAFMAPERASLITTGNTADHLELLADCDWIVEVIVEQPAPKQELFARLERIAPNAIVTSNTSGIPMAVLLEGRNDAFKRQFLGTHFFNPPRYMHLLELIPTPFTAPATLEAMREFSERTLGKGIVLCKDVPGFVANRLGVFGMFTTFKLMEEFNLTIDEVDGLTGALIGRAKTATFRTGDLSGLDVLAHVSAGLSQATGEDFLAPALGARDRQARLARRQVGRRLLQEGRQDILTLDWHTLEYVPQQRLSTPEIDALLKLPVTERLARVRDLPGRYGDFLRKLLTIVAYHTARLAPTGARHRQHRSRPRVGLRLGDWPVPRDGRAGHRLAAHPDRHHGLRRAIPVSPRHRRLLRGVRQRRADGDTQGIPAGAAHPASPVAGRPPRRWAHGG